MVWCESDSQEGNGFKASLQKMDVLLWELPDAGREWTRSLEQRLAGVSLQEASYDRLG